MQKISADLVITNTGKPIENGVIVYDDHSGEILDIGISDDLSGDTRHCKGLLVPGYVNAHCHLELSHLKGVIPSGTGLIPFIKGVVSLREFPREEIDEKIVAADKEMFQNGIVAVGDISNKSDTALVKSESQINYYTFVEMFDFLQDQQAEQTFNQYQKVFEEQSDIGENRRSYVPHAPYSVSPTLFTYVNDRNKAGDTISIHNQELDAENEFFINKNGAFLDFFKSFGISIDDFVPIGKTSINYTLAQLSPKFKTLMVHNTKSSKEDITKALLWNNQTYWVTCPNANLYIENTLPKYENFLDCGATLCIGTDSLSSNWQLSIFDEMKTIKKFQSGIDDLEIIRWATLNGAKALGYNNLGTFTKGLKPGINLIDVVVKNGKFDLSYARSSTKII